MSMTTKPRLIRSKNVAFTSDIAAKPTQSPVILLYQGSHPNKLKSLKVAQVKDEMDGDDDDGIDVVL